MPPVGVGASRFASALETGVAKLWVVLIGVDRYLNVNLPSLRYAAVDCQGIGAALAAATKPFPDREFLIHHDLVTETPTLARVASSLHRVVTEAQVQDTVLLYFSGHGVVEPNTQQTVLCVRDTEREQLLSTGLPIQVVLELLGHCAAHSQLVWLDACHSGNLNLIGSNRERAETARLNPTTQLLASLRQQAAQSRGFYALLSCDEGQQSWEFPDLGHGVFSYFLMRGLWGEAADAQGVIDADSLYRYVYRQTVQYIDRINQQLRLADRENRDFRWRTSTSLGTGSLSPGASQVSDQRGKMSWCPEYSAQTPKRIVSGVGEIILGLKPSHYSVWHDRTALIIGAGAASLGSRDYDNDLSEAQIDDPLSQVLQQEGKFTLDYLPNSDGAELLVVDAETQLRQRIHTFLADDNNHRCSDGDALQTMGAISTRLLYLRGQITDLEGEDAWFLMENGVKLSRAWLRQELHRAKHIQQIIILDCPAAPLSDRPDPNIAADWVEALKITDDSLAERLCHGDQCIIACAAPAEDAELFAQVLLEALISAPPQMGMPVASLFTRLQTNLDELGLPCHFSLCGTQGLIEILPARADPVELLSADLPDLDLPMAPQPEPEDSDAVEEPEITCGQDDTEIQVEVATSPTTAIPTVFAQSLESILRRLVGPIAPALLAACASDDSRWDGKADRVSHHWQLTDPATLVKNLLPRLPAHARADFEQQVATLLSQQPERVEIDPVINPTSGTDRSTASITPSAKTIPPLITTPPQSYIPPSTRSAIEQTLNQIIGPVAQVLLGQIAPTAWATEQDLLAALSTYLTADRLAEFSQRLQPLLESSPLSIAEPSPTSPQNVNGRGIEPTAIPAIDDKLTIACEQQLTLAIGPIAKFIIATTKKTNPHLSPADFVKVLAITIPDPIQAETFRRHMNIS
jgi:uncharacterized caspase-like protein